MDRRGLDRIAIVLLLLAVNMVLLWAGPPYSTFNGSSVYEYVQTSTERIGEQPSKDGRESPAAQ